MDVDSGARLSRHANQCGHCNLLALDGLLMHTRVNTCRPTSKHSSSQTKMLAIKCLSSNSKKWGEMLFSNGNAKSIHPFANANKPARTNLEVIKKLQNASSVSLPFHWTGGCTLQRQSINLRSGSTCSYYKSGRMRQHLSYSSSLVGLVWPQPNMITVFTIGQLDVGWRARQDKGMFT